MNRVPLELSNVQLLKWVGNQLSQLATERRQLLRIQEDKFLSIGRSGANHMNAPRQGSRLFDIGIIISYLKSLEVSVLDQMEGTE